MTPLAVLLLGAVGTYLLRVTFILVVPAHRLPQRLRNALQLVGPAALAALVATDICYSASHPSALWPTIAAVIAAGIVAALSRNLGLTIVGGLLSGLMVTVLI